MAYGSNEYNDIVVLVRIRENWESNKTNEP